MYVICMYVYMIDVLYRVYRYVCVCMYRRKDEFLIHMIYVVCMNVCMHEYTINKI